MGWLHRGESRFPEGWQVECPLGGTLSNAIVMLSLAWMAVSYAKDKLTSVGFCIIVCSFAIRENFD
jgi:hypothetical protein